MAAKKVLMQIEDEYFSLITHIFGDFLQMCNIFFIFTENDFCPKCVLS